MQFYDLSNLGLGQKFSLFLPFVISARKPRMPYIAHYNVIFAYIAQYFNTNLLFSIIICLALLLCLVPSLSNNHKSFVIDSRPNFYRDILLMYASLSYARDT